MKRTMIWNFGAIALLSSLLLCAPTNGASAASHKPGSAVEKSVARTKPHAKPTSRKSKRLVRVPLPIARPENCAYPPGKDKPFDGVLLFRCAYEAVRDTSKLLLDDPAKAKAFAERWESRYTKPGDLSTPESADLAVSIMVSSIGERFNYFYDDEGTTRNEERADSTTGGIGVDLQLEASGSVRNLWDSGRISETNPLSVKVLPDKPAAQVGMKDGDIILEVNGATVNSHSIETISKLIDGEVGGIVTLLLKRDDNVWSQELTRVEIRQPVVTRSELVDPDVYMIRLEHFSADHLQEEMAEAGKKAKNAPSILLDLRGNHGGRLDFADFVAAMFLCQGNYLTLNERDGDKVVTKKQVFTPDVVLTSLSSAADSYEQSPRETKCIAPHSKPMVVMINGDSASASEIVSGTLQVNRRATIMGEPSVGKGVGQNMINLPFHRSMAIIAFDFQPGGENIDWSGVIPDIVVSGKKVVELGTLSLDPQLAEAVKYLKDEVVKSRDRQNEHERLLQKRRMEFFPRTNGEQATIGFPSLSSSFSWLPLPVPADFSQAK